MKYFRKHKFTTIILIVFSIFVYLNYTKPVTINPLVNKDSIHYTNDLYMSNARVYNNYLTTNQKKVYLTLLENSKKRKSKTIIDCQDYGCKSADEFRELLRVAGEALMSDHPELLSYAFYSFKVEDKEMVLRLEHSVALGLFEQIGIERIKRIIENQKIETKDMSDREKILYVYTWIGKNNKYDRLFTFNSKNQSIYNVFMHRNAVCAGFAKASQIIFQNIGIESYAVTGYSTGYHMWNIVKLDGEFYNYDSTAAAGQKENSTYFLWGLQSKNMEKYKFDFPEWYPPISHNDMNIK